MKKIILLIAIGFAAFACKNETKESETKEPETKAEIVKDEIAYASFGEKIDDKDALVPDEMMKKYQNLKIGDTIDSKMVGKIKEVCSKKGCWMKIEMDGKNEKEVMVKFKDYGFFMPLNAEGEVVINGKAFVSETPVEELRHYAEDAGKSKEEIAKITESKFEYHFLADGVLLKQ